MIQIDMKMPDNCDECRFNTEYAFCKAMPDNFCGNTDDRKRPEWCPLKEQEAKPMTEYDDGWDCPRCGLKLVGKTASGYPYAEFDLPDDEIVKYCPVCGQAVKWNG